MGSYSTFIIPKQYCYGREFPLVEIQGASFVPCLGASENSSLCWIFGKLRNLQQTHTLSTTVIEKIHGTPPYKIGRYTIWYTPSINLPKLVSASHLFWPYHQGFHCCYPPRPMLAIHPWPCRFVIWVLKRFIPIGRMSNIWGVPKMVVPNNYWLSY